MEDSNVRRILDNYFIIYEELNKKYGAVESHMDIDEKYRRHIMIMDILNCRQRRIR